MRAYWTEPEIKILKDMAKAGKTVDVICKVLRSRTPNGINGKAKELGISLAGPEPEIDLDEFARQMKGDVKCL